MVDQTVDQKSQLQNIGLEPRTIEDTLKNSKLCKLIIEIIQASGLTKCEKKKGNLLYGIASKLTDKILQHKVLLAQYVGSGKLTAAQQLDSAIEYLNKQPQDAQIDANDFEKKCGIGAPLTEKEVQAAIDLLFQEKDKELKQWRYAIDQSEYQKILRERHPLAEGKMLNQLFKNSLEKLLGPATEQDQKLKQELLKQKQKKEVKKEKENEKDNDDDIDNEPRKKITDLIGRDMASLGNSIKHLQWHKEKFGDNILTRFPPEPNGYLHIGHAKAIRFSFTVALDYKGFTYLRYDDTNPEKETKEFIDMIKENVQWLGFQPWKVTYASDNFELLYKYAVEMIKKDKAYVDEQTPEQMHEYREKGLPSPYRNRPVEESLRMFENMRLGLYEEGKFCLRAKIDPTHPNTTMRDPVMYRIRYTPHPHAGDKWCIYPLYDYTHPICDSVEGITHSLCTLEFEIRRDLYYWYLEALDIYRPYVWEYSRLNISNTVLSKRKLQQLVYGKLVSGWNDPRLLTIEGMRRRGYTAEGIMDFCELVSVTRRGNENFINFCVLEHCIRKDLDVKAPRVLSVIDPVLVHITNVPENFQKIVNQPNFPTQPDKGSKQILLLNEVYVEREDVRAQDHKEFFGMAPNKLVGLKYAGIFKVTKVTTDPNSGEVKEVFCEYLEDCKEKPKAFLNWVSVKESVNCEVRLYDLLFTEYDPNKRGDEWLSALNKNSLTIVKNAKMNKNLLGSKILDRFQFERQGYFSVDYDSNIKTGQYIWNRIVGLSDKERQKAMKRMNDADIKK